MKNNTSGGLGIEPICLLWGRKENTNMHEKYGKIREMEFIPYIPKVIQITWSKFHFVREEPETTWLIGDIDQIALTGEYANGIDSGNIEVIINGTKVNNDYLENIKPKIKKKIGREVSFFVNQKLDSNSIILFKKIAK